MLFKIHNDFLRLPQHSIELNARGVKCLIKGLVNICVVLGLPYGQQSRTRYKANKAF